MRKNARFLISGVGHYLPSDWMNALLGDRYPSFRRKAYDLCIEGVQRSGNTFFVTLFQHWNPAAKIAHHTHLAGTVKTSIRRKVPAVVLVRKPEDAVASLIAWDPQLCLATALASYTTFHRSLWRQRRAFVILRFEDIIACPGQAVAAINLRFGVSFEYSDLSAELRELIFGRVDKQDRKLERDVMNSSLPTAEKQELTARLKPAIRRHPLFPSADRWYLKYREASVNLAGN